MGTDVHRGFHPVVQLSGLAGRDGEATCFKLFQKSAIPFDPEGSQVLASFQHDTLALFSRRGRSRGLTAPTSYASVQTK